MEYIAVFCMKEDGSSISNLEVCTPHAIARTSKIRIIVVQNMWDLVAGELKKKIVV